MEFASEELKSLCGIIGAEAAAKEQQRFGEDDDNDIISTDPTVQFSETC